MRNSIVAAVLILSGAVAAGAAIAKPDEDTSKTFAADVNVTSVEATFVKKSGAVSVRRLSLGQVEVIFKKDLSACYSQATPALIAQIYTQPRTGNAKGIFVSTQNSSGKLVDVRFTLTVFCPDT